MQNSLKHKTKSLLFAVMLTVSTLTCAGCSAPQKIECERPAPLPAEMSEPQSPGARAFSEKVRNFLPKAESYFSETPLYMMP